MASQILLVDANSLIHRAYHAISSLSTSTGQPTNATYGFVQMLLRLLQEEYPEPDVAILAFDAPGPTFRHEISEEYKADRPPMDEELASQFDMIREFADAMGFVSTELEGYEADDVIGRLAKEASEAGDDVTIVTGDRDLCQLVDENVRVLANIRGITETKLYGEEEVEEEFGVAPDVLADLKGLAGDSSDNIPGIQGVGPKTAQKLLAQFDSVEEIYEHLEGVEADTLREKLAASEDTARLSKTLARIDCDAPIEGGLLQERWRGLDIERLRALMAELEFTSLLRRLPEKERPEGAFEAVESVEEARELCSRARDSSTIGIALGYEGEVAVGLALAVNEGDVNYLGLPRKSENEGLFSDSDDGGLPECVVELLSDPEVEKVGHDLKATARALSQFGAELEGFGFDTAVGAYLIAPQHGHQEIDTLVGRYFGETLPSMEAGDSEEASVAGMRAALEAAYVLQLREPLLADLEDIGERDLFEDVEMPLIKVLRDMEAAGIGIDEERFDEIGDKLEGKMLDVSQRIYSIAGEEFNLDSPKQVGEVLFDKLELPRGRRTKTGWSTSASVLEKLAPDHEIAGLILQYREYSKLKSTYVDGMLPLVCPQDGRIHTTLQQTVVATGRLSSRNPNLQNIPVRSEFGREIRSCFAAQGEGNVLLDADYSQIELRILAHMSGDERLVEAFQAGQDIHKRTAAEIFGVAIDDVDRQMRQAAKTVNYAVIYGMGATALAAQLGVERSQAKQFIDDYFERLPRVEAYMEGTVERAREHGYVATLFGRRRPMPDIDSSNGRVRSYAERAAANAPLQGTAADIIKMAMIELHEQMPQVCPECRMLLQVHDDLLFELPEVDVEKVGNIVKEVMEGVADLDVPLKVEPKAGPNWRDMKPLW